MIVHHNQRRGPELERALDHFARVDRRMVDGAALLTLMLDQHILAVEKQEMEFLDFAVTDLRGAKVDQLVPRADHGPFEQFRPHQPQRRLTHQFDASDRRWAEPDSCERFGIGAQYLGEAPEALDQLCYQRLRIGAWVGGEKYHLEDFGIGKVFGSGEDQTPAQPFPVAIKAAEFCRQQPHVALRKSYPMAALGTRGGSWPLRVRNFGLRHDRSLSRWTDIPPSTRCWLTRGLR